MQAKHKKSNVSNKSRRFGVLIILYAVPNVLEWQAELVAVIEPIQPVAQCAKVNQLKPNRYWLWKPKNPTAPKSRKLLG